MPTSRRKKMKMLVANIFLLFPTMFYILDWDKFSMFQITLNLSSANAFNLTTADILTSGEQFMSGSSKIKVKL